MKKRLAALLVALVLLGAGVAVALGGGSGDPLVTLSFLNDQFWTDLMGRLNDYALTAAKPTYDDAAGRLDAAGEADLELAGSFPEAGGYIPRAVKADDRLELKEGASLVLYRGAGQVSEGTLADVTAGDTVEAGAALTASHRYIVTSSQGAEVRFTQDGSMAYVGDGLFHEAPAKDFSFTDVKEGDWYWSAVVYVYNRGYFSGVSTTAFAPDTSMNRAMLATVLHRMAGEPAVQGSTVFTDVPEGQWYSKGILWAGGNGVVNGMGDGLYQPMSAVTREQMVTMLHRYYEKWLKGTPTANGDLDAFPDGDSVSGWARDAMVWATGEGIIRGRDTGCLDPGGTATRAEVAVIIQRFTDLLEKP